MNKRNEYGQQKQFFRRQGPSNFKRSTFKPQGEVDPYSPDFAPMNILKIKWFLREYTIFQNVLDQI